METHRLWWPWIRAPLLSAFGLMSVQFAIGAGLPLDKWARDLGAKLSLHMSLEEAAWGVSALVALVLFLLGTYWPQPRARLNARMSSANHLDHNDYKKIDARKRLELWEVACFWAGEKPALPLSMRAEASFRKLEQALENRSLDVNRADLREVISDAYDRRVHKRINKANPHWLADREDLKSYALGIGEKPPFLFPKERT